MGGDTRYLEVINILSQYGANLLLCGYDKQPFNLPNVRKLTMNEINFSEIDLLLLAISGTDLSGNVSTAFSDEKLVLTEAMIAETPTHCVIIAGSKNEYLIDICKSRKLIDLYESDEVAIYNSVPTAEGTLMKAMEETDYTIHHSKVLVLGFGRVGFTIANLF